MSNHDECALDGFVTTSSNSTSTKNDTQQRKNLLALICNHDSKNSSCENEEEQEEEAEAELNFMVSECQKIVSTKQYVKKLTIRHRQVLDSGSRNLFYEVRNNIEGRFNFKLTVYVSMSQIPTFQIHTLKPFDFNAQLLWANRWRHR